VICRNIKWQVNYWAIKYIKKNSKIYRIEHGDMHNDMLIGKEGVKRERCWGNKKFTEHVISNTISYICSFYFSLKVSQK